MWVGKIFSISRGYKFNEDLFPIISKLIDTTGYCRRNAWISLWNCFHGLCVYWIEYLQTMEDSSQCPSKIKEMYGNMPQSHYKYYNLSEPHHICYSIDHYIMISIYHDTQWLCIQDRTCLNPSPVTALQSIQLISWVACCFIDGRSSTFIIYPSVIHEGLSL